MPAGPPPLSTLLGLGFLSDFYAPIPYGSLGGRSFSAGTPFGVNAGPINATFPYADAASITNNLYNSLLYNPSAGGIRGLTGPEIGGSQDVLVESLFGGDFAAAIDAIQQMQHHFGNYGIALSAGFTDLEVYDVVQRRESYSTESAYGGTYTDPYGNLIPALESRYGDARAARAAEAAAADSPRIPWGRSLQAGPFVPCSADDPRGRCVHPILRERVNDSIGR